MHVQFGDGNIYWNKTGSSSEESMDESIIETPIETVVHEPQDVDIYRCIEDIVKYPEKAERRLQVIKLKVQELIAQDRVSSLIKEANEFRKGETVLHTAIKSFQFKLDEEKKVVELLISKCPQLILQDRRDTEYTGQTPLHMAVSKGNIWLVSTLLKLLSKRDMSHWKITLLKGDVIGQMFINTVMMGGLPLTIAALTFNKGMFDLLLSEGAELDGTNRFGDNVCHSLIRYGYLYPDKSDDVIDMFRKINEDPATYEKTQRAVTNRKLRKKIWLMENLESLNPLQLAATLGQHKVFAFIMSQEAYCCENSKDGLFDIKIYDVTEIDAISSMNSADITGVNESIVGKVTPENLSRRSIISDKEPFRKSILAIIFDLEPTVAFQFILFPPLMRVVNRKWRTYCKFFYPWWFLHSIFMFFLTWYCVERSKQNANTATGYDVNKAPAFSNKIPKDAFVTTYGVICLIMSAVYVVQDLVRMIKGRMPWTYKSFWNPYSNGWFRVMFISFGVCLIVDFFVSIWSEHYENYLLIFAMIIGWFLSIFFIRAVRPFSFFTVIIQKILIGDMLRFFVIIGIEIIAFATAMYMVIQGSEAANDTDFTSFWSVLFSMFNLMVGLGDMAAIYNTRHPILCIIIMIGFVLMTTLLMVNALIAMMSRTCMELVENVGNRHWKLQKLSMILFLESILPNRFIVKVGTEQSIQRYNNVIHRRKLMKRFVLEIRSLQNEDEDDDDSGSLSTTWGLKTAVFNALKNRQNSSRERPLSGLSDKIRLLFKTRNKKKKKPERSDITDQQLDSTEIRPVQIQPPVSHVFGLNPNAADNGFQIGGVDQFRPKTAEIDIYNINLCRQCSVTEIEKEDKRY